MKFIALLVFVGLSSGCANLHCEPHQWSKAGPPNMAGRIWELPAGGSVRDVGFIAGRCNARTDAHIALVKTGSKEFIGTIRPMLAGKILADWATMDVSGEELLDDFTTRQTSTPAARGNCRPEDLAALKRDNGIESINARIVVASNAPTGRDEIEFASRWVMQCIPTGGPIVWLTTDRRLIGTFTRGEGFDDFR